MASTTRRAMTDIEQPGYYATSFSTGAGYYLLTYKGPDVPWQKVKKSDNEKFNINLEENASLRSLLNGTQIPTRRWSTVEINGHGKVFYIIPLRKAFVVLFCLSPPYFSLLFAECNYMEFLPPGFSSDQKHPVLFQVYVHVFADCQHTCKRHSSKD